MSLEHEILNAYHRKIGRHEKRTGESFPLVRVNCVDLVKGVITTTNVWVSDGGREIQL